MHGPLSPDERAQIRRLPFISRAREHRLYAVDGTRWADCWLDGGRALLGHRPAGLGQRIKNELDRGLTAPYPSRWEARLGKALHALFPGYAAIRIYRNPEAAARAVGLPAPPADPLDAPPAVPAGNAVPAPALWGRPLLPDHPPAERLFPVLPTASFGALQPVLFAEEPRDADASDLLPPMALAALARACRLCLAAGASPEAGNAPDSAGSADIWEKRGPYLLFRGAEAEYDRLFDALFHRRILIAPSAGRPTILPFTATPKETAALLRGGAPE